MDKPESLTALLNAAHAGDEMSSTKAYAAVYAELKRCARGVLRGADPTNALTATALVHETYVRLSTNASNVVNDRHHFYALAAKAMRQLLVDQSRRDASLKRGGAVAITGFDADLPLSVDLASALELDAALRALEERDYELSRIVEWHFFAGMDFREIARALGRHERTVRRDWELARAFLRRTLSAAGA